jgi:hypothetical protein
MVRSTQGQVNRYAPQPVPEQYDSAYLRNELQQIQFALSQIADGQLDVTTVAPAKPRDGMIRRSGATGWNPGSGQGVYCYYNGAWRLLG